MLKKLRLKFVVINMAIVTVMLCAIFATVYHFTKRNLEAESIRMMQQIAASPVQLLRPGQRQEEIRLPYFLLQLGPHGEMLAASGGYYDLSDEAFLREVADAAFAWPEQTGVLEEYALRFYRTSAPGAQRLVFADISSEQATLDHLIQSCLLIGGSSFLVFLGLSLLLARWAVKPVERAWARQKQFVADASHELKTPLTVILTNAELLQNPACSQQERGQFTESILLMARQMRGLAESLLELARVDGGGEKTAFSPLSFSELTEEALLPFEPLYFEKGLSLRSRVESGITLTGCAAQLRQLLDILLDNAMKYASPQATVELTLEKQGSHCLLTVANPGEAIPQEELKNIFKRFYRLDKARSMNHSYGLGLAIAEGIVREHRGKIWAASGEGVNRFFVQLPL